MRRRTALSVREASTRRLPAHFGQEKTSTLKVRWNYFFAHTSELAAAHGVGFAFGAGAGGQTTPETDNGNLVAKVRAYAQAGGQAACAR
jgi:hypothetical protein